MAYTIIRDNNTFTINTNGGNSLYVTVYIQTSCGSNEWEILLPEQFTNGILIVNLPNKDNLYKIQITDKQELNDFINISIYKEFLISFVESIKDLLCGCPCEECDDCNKKDKDYSSVLLKLLAYNIINESIYNQYLTLTNDCIKCNILDINQCILINETVIGNSDNTLLMKQLIAYYYLVFYYTDLKLNNNSLNITTLYNYNNIIKCIKKLGINIDCIKDNINIEHIQPKECIYISEILLAYGGTSNTPLNLNLNYTTCEGEDIVFEQQYNTDADLTIILNQCVQIDSLVANGINITNIDQDYIIQNSNDDTWEIRFLNEPCNNNL